MIGYAVPTPLKIGNVPRFAYEKWAYLNCPHLLF